MTDVHEPDMHSDAAELDLLGAVAYYPDQLTSVLARLPGSDFYDPQRGLVWDAARALSENRQQIEPTSIARYLVTHGQWASGTQRVVQQELINAGTPARAEIQADLVADYARRRQLFQALKRMYRTAGTHPGTASDALADIRAELDQLEDPTEHLHGGTRNWSQMLDEFVEAHKPESKRVGIPTPWQHLDALIGGFFPGRVYVIGGSAGDGKALALDTPIPTPTGWTTMGAIQTGDRVMGADGLPCRVTRAYDVRLNRPCFEVQFSDGSTIVADAEHQWLTDTVASRDSTRNAARIEATRGASPLSRDQRHLRTTAAVVTTAQIAATLRTEKAAQRLNHSIPTCQPLAFRTANLLIDPYVLGVWLGDGHSAGGRFTSADPEIPLAVQAAGQPVVKHQAQLNYGLPGITPKLRAVGVLDNKHIPQPYLRASEEQRRALLQGLMDTDGTVWPNGTIEFGTTSKQLADGVYELLVSLGYRTQVCTKTVHGRSEASSTCYMMRFTAAEKCFRLTRKLERQRTPQGGRTSSRFITAVRPVPSVPVRCIEVNTADHLYLAGRSMIPTHNSTAALNIARHAAALEHPTLVFSREMPVLDVFSRLVSAPAAVELGAMNRRELSEFQIRQVRKYAQAEQLPLRVNADPVNLAGMKTITRAHRHKHRLDLLVVDYLQLIEVAGGRTQEEEIAKASTALKHLAMELDIPLVVPAQLNRAPHARPDTRPTKADLRGSGRIEQDADVVILLHHRRDERGQRTGEITFIVDKNRHGPPGEFTLTFNGGYGAIA